MSWGGSFTPPWPGSGVPPTNRRVEFDIVVVVQFSGELIACERVYWDHATVLRQVGLLGSSAGATASTQVRRL